jgi:hypothetical protein
MTETIPLRCRCGAMRGALELDRARSCRMVCACVDCQAFARFCDRADLLDADGGTDLFQADPSRVTITEGAEYLCCMRLSAKGLARFYAGCCRTPIGNAVATGTPPFIGLIDNFVDTAAVGLTRDQALGPVRGRVFVATGPHAAPAARLQAQARVVPHTMKVLFFNWLRRAEPQPFFAPGASAPRVPPEVLGKEARDALRAPNERAAG